MTLLYRVMVVSWRSVLAAAVVPVLKFSYNQARTLFMNSSHVFLGLCCASDSELAAAKVKHSVAIRVISSSEDLQLVSTRRVLHRLLRICKTYDVVVHIWVSIETGEPLVCVNTLYERNCGTTICR